MHISGFEKFSLIDYPGKLACIVFTQGCNFKCGYCHNPELNNISTTSKGISEKKILDFLDSRKGKLDAVVITGGEPTLQKDLIPFIQRVRAKGFLVKLDSNGSNPAILKKLMAEKLIDFIAMDVKAPMHKYEKIAGTKVNKENIFESIQLIQQSHIPYEFRTTMVKSQLNENDLNQMSVELKNAQQWVLQKFNPQKTLNPNFSIEKTYSTEELNAFTQKFKNQETVCSVR